MSSTSESKRIPGICTPREGIGIATALLFLGLAAYIAFFLELPGETPRDEFYMIAALTGAYGLIRLWRSISACLGRHNERDL